MAEAGAISPPQTPFVSVRGVKKTFGGVHALDDVSFDLYTGISLAWSATTAPASRPLSKSSRGPLRPRMARSRSMVGQSRLRRPLKPSGLASKRFIRTCH
jgi:ABC-type phosphonate transport system ATPase subunit